MQRDRNEPAGDQPAGRAGDQSPVHGGDRPDVSADRGMTIVAGRPTAETGVATAEQAAVKEYVDRSLLFMHSTPHLMEMAKQKDDYLAHHSGDLGPVGQAAIAKTLLAICDTVQERIDHAPRNADGVRTPEGVSWKPGDPLAGRAEAIEPFGRAAQWQAFVDRAATGEKPGHGTGPRGGGEYGRGDERGMVAAPHDGVGFRYGSARLEPGQMQRWLAGLEPGLREALHDPSARIRIVAGASRPGTEKDNLALSQHRADAVATWLRRNGATATIEVTGVGETPAREQGRPNVDNANDRTARIEFTNWTADFRGEGDTLQADRGYAGPHGHEAEFRKETAERLLYGRPWGIITQAHDVATQLATLASGPSRMGLHAAEKVSGLVEKLMPEAVPVTLFLKYLDALVEIGESGRAKDVADVRRAYYDAVGLGVARGLYGGYRPELPDNPILHAAAERTQRDVESMSPTERRNLAQYLAETAAGAQGSRERYEQFLGGAGCQAGMKRLLEHDGYLFR
jgi:outer membrane protein OmpA-like peptidoglycan-associated protein